MSKVLSSNDYQIKKWEADNILSRQHQVTQTTSKNIKGQHKVFNPKQVCIGYKASSQSFLIEKDCT